jgi:hypothetical protein
VALLATDIPTETTAPSPTPTDTPEPPAAALVDPADDEPTPAAAPIVDDPDPVGLALRPETVVGGLGVVAVLLYIAFYLRGAAAVERYAGGFVVERCPVCHDGRLTVDTRQDRLLGIPRARRTVRCDSCRSVLRETGHRRWRYAVDRLENPAMYERFNGQEVDEQTLKELLRQPVVPVSGPVTPPSFVDGEDG